MNDDFLYDMRRTPPPEFAARLRARLATQGADEVTTTSSAAHWRALNLNASIRRGATIAAVLVVTVGLATIPAVRASAQAFLNLFRVTNFVAVPVDTSRLDRLAERDLSLERLIGEQVEILVPPAPPQPFLTPQLAATAAGIPVRLPSTLPAGLEQVEVRMLSGRTVRVTADVNKLQRVLESLQIDDVAIPDGLHGQQVTLAVPPIVEVQYRQRAGYTSEEYRSDVSFVQAKSPHVELPRGLNLAELAQIGLRVLGFNRDEAARFAGAINWNTTMVVPVPANAAEFHQISVNGHPGLVVATAPRPRKSGRGEERTTIVLWSDGAQVFGIKGTLQPVTLMEMANSVH
jgi:hypothetical protein